MSLGNNVSSPKKRRIRSLDMIRCFIVLLSVFLSSIPTGAYAFADHAGWYGVTLIDLVFPGFVTVFGVSMAVAYQNRVNWNRQLKVAGKLILYGLLFNMIVAWSLDFSTLRFTGVLQVYSMLGIVGAIAIYYIKSPIKLVLLGVLSMSIYSALFLISGNGCENAITQPFCNLSWSIDPAVFGEAHIYAQGLRGYDPEGIPAIFGALGNILFGLAAGRLLIENKDGSKFNSKLILLGLILLILAFVFSTLTPFGKRMWTPSFTFLTAGITTWLLALFHTLFDRLPTCSIGKNVSGLLNWFLSAFGQNSFLIYFGKFILISVLLNVKIPSGGESISTYQKLYGWIEQISANPPLTYALLILGVWTTVALILHKYKWYLKV